MGIFSRFGIKENKALQEAHEELFQWMMHNLPDGMNPAPEVRKSMRKSVDKVTLETARKVQELIIARRPEHIIIVLLVQDALERRGSNASLNRIVDNFDYMISIGWGYTGAMIGLVLRAFPDALLSADLTAEQQHALLRLEASRWNSKFTVNGGSKSMKRSSDHPCITDVALKHPQHIERIIDIAIFNNPASEGHYEALLGAAISAPLKHGVL